MGLEISYRLQFLVYRALEGSAASRSWDRRVSLGRTMGRLWRALDSHHRRVARDNLRGAFPDWDSDRIEKVQRSNFEHLGITMAEFLGLPGETPETASRHWELRGREHLEEALGRGKGVFLLSGHLGNWELMLPAGAVQGYPLHGVARRIKNPLVNARVLAARERFGARVIRHRNAVRPIMKVLRSGGVVGFLMDQKASSREGVRSEFFGRPVSTNQGLALLALKTGAPVVPVFGRREQGGHVFRLGSALESPQGADREESVARFTRQFDETIEAAVRDCPEQWFWVHRRWRLPREMES